MFKKALIGLLILLIVAAGAGAVYYFFFKPPAEIDLTPNPEDSLLAEPVETAQDDSSIVEYQTYYVISTSANVYAKDNFESTLIGEVTLRDEVEVYEQKGRWSRIQEWSNEVTGASQWVYSAHLSEEHPHETDVERYRNLKRLLRASDDFEANESRFIELTNELLLSGQCSEADLAQVQGWIRSFNYPDEPIYYTYCGGLEVDDKLYLNLATGQSFR